MSVLVKFFVGVKRDSKRQERSSLETKKKKKNAKGPKHKATKGERNPRQKGVEKARQVRSGLIVHWEKSQEGGGGT